MTIKFLDLHAQYLTLKDAIDTAVAGVIRDSAYVGGPRITRFEERFAAFQQAAHCVAMANGTDAIEIALEALALPPQSEVIVPANSFIASSEAVTRSGFRVVFADVDAATSTLDVADVAKRITSRTKAIMAVHLYGHPCDLDGLGALAKHHGLRIIEDCAQAHGAEFRGRRVGAIGDIGSFSFYPGKNLGAYGDGGAVVTNDAALAKRCRMISNHGRIDKYNHEFEGRNSRLDGLQAAILDVKLDHLDRWVNTRNELASAYLTGLRGLEGLTLPAPRADVRHGYHLFVVRTQRRDDLAAFLQKEGIQTGIHYPISLPKLAAYGYMGKPDESMRANQFDSLSLSLPIGEHLSVAQVETVCDAVRRWHTAR